VLVIDDVRTFRFDCAHARTLTQALSLLEDSWDEVWFDHDLGQGETVRPAVLWLDEQIAKWRTARDSRGRYPLIEPIGRQVDL
jgi:NAD+-processing family protein with receiver domain